MKLKLGVGRAFRASGLNTGVSTRLWEGGDLLGEGSETITGTGNWRQFVRSLLC